MRRPAPRALAFDLDGTLLDTAPDLIAATATVCQRRGRPLANPAALRGLVSQGASALVQATLGLARGDPGQAAAVRELVACYARDPARHTRLFDGMQAVLERAAALRMPWCVVTNKPEALARLVMHAMGPLPGYAGLVGVGTTLHAKPHGQPLRLAAHLTGTSAAALLFVGDDRRDVLAARAVGATALAAAWGYRTAHDDIHGWGADAVCEQPEALLAWLDAPEQYARR